MGTFSCDLSIFFAHELRRLNSRQKFKEFLMGVSTENPMNSPDAQPNSHHMHSDNAKPGFKPNRRLAVLEVGCGLQIKRARNKAEQIVSELRAMGVEV
jgi:hypothetical protein